MQKIQMIFLNILPKYHAQNLHLSVPCFYGSNKSITDHRWYPNVVRTKEWDNWGTAKYFTGQLFIPHFDVIWDFYCTDPQQHGICLAAFYDKNAKGC